ncbi:hypothetical protein, partial [Erwinia amylovora]|uniref:hypothetical protein n=1 Tax=Erwinia amylovora TaxID=552 RepID=UPI0020BF0CD6
YNQINDERDFVFVFTNVVFTNGDLTIISKAHRIATLAVKDSHQLIGCLVCFGLVVPGANDCRGVNNLPSGGSSVLRYSPLILWLFAV